MIAIVEVVDNEKDAAGELKDLANRIGAFAG